MLWLASRIGDHEFVTREGQKVAKLVEGDARERPAPIVSFIARQRDLRELVGEHGGSAEGHQGDGIAAGHRDLRRADRRAEHHRERCR